MDALTTITAALVPVCIIAVVCWGLYKRINVFDAFVDGVKEAMGTIVRLLPVLLAMMVAIGVLRSSGALEQLTVWIQPMAEKIGIPGEIIPLVILRPISGSAATAMLATLFEQIGADGYAARVASVMMGSTETIVYTISIYFGAVGIKRGRHALAVALISQLAGLAAALWLCSWI